MLLGLCTALAACSLRPYEFSADEQVPMEYRAAADVILKSVNDALKNMAAPGDPVAHAVRLGFPRVPDNVEEFLPGQVTVWFTIGTQGKVTGASILKSTNSALSIAALDAVRVWEVTPVIRRGRPIEIQLEQTFQDVCHGGAC